MVLQLVDSTTVKGKSGKSFTKPIKVLAEQSLKITNKFYTTPYNFKKIDYHSKKEFTGQKTKQESFPSVSPIYIGQVFRAYPEKNSNDVNTIFFQVHVANLPYINEETTLQTGGFCE
ncbi:hypothetical protein ACWF7H_25530 [Peribacillus butanolivorans]|uniref:hypothetical protein n=1 Tax=Peribacillus butanolivorans TaxID=421767 RepID=UPI0036BDF885